MRKQTALIILLSAFLLSACAARGEAVPKTEAKSTPSGAEAVRWPKDKLTLNSDGVPQLRVYVVEDEQIENLDMETYVQGVLAGEMKNDWPMEALKAQAILARTFVLKFCDEKESKYAGADISTDIEEAQAYDATAVNERVEQAVKETEGLVLSNQGELPYAWFHAHSGGMTAKAKEGLNYEKEEPAYTRVTAGMESEKAPADAAAWEATFGETEFVAAARKSGLKNLKELETVEVGERGVSGRAVTLMVNGSSVPAANLRIQLGSTKMRSTLLSSLKLEDGKVYMAGKGYGHGVGMPQWGAYGLAETGKTAEEIVTYYFQDVSVEKVW